jgi:hypothetical protein
MRALPSTFDATSTIGGPLIIRLLLQPPPKPLLADSKSTGADSDTFHMVLELLKSKCGSPKQGRTRSYHVNGDTRHHIFEATLLRFETLHAPFCGRLALSFPFPFPFRRVPPWHSPVLIPCKTFQRNRPTPIPAESTDYLLLPKGFAKSLATSYLALTIDKL